MMHRLILVLKITAMAILSGIVAVMVFCILFPDTTVLRAFVGGILGCLAVFVLERAMWWLGILRW